MAYKESNPGVTQSVLFIILLSLLILIHLIVVVFAVNLFLSLMDPSDMEPTGLMATFCSLYNLIPLTLVYMIVVFGVAMYRRGVYGEAHEKATLAALLVLLIGPIVPFFLFVLSFMFDKGYYAIPFLLHFIVIIPFVSLFLQVKDIGGKVQSATGLTIYTVGSLMLVGIETFAIAIGDDMEEETGQLLSALSIPWTIVLLVGVIFFLLAYIKALSWVKAHKPKIDDQQAQQISMQKQQITMQIRSLEMQKQQLEMQEKALTMLSDIRSDQLLGADREMIPERAEGPKKDEGPPAEPSPGVRP